MPDLFTVQMLRKNLGFMDLDSVGTAASPALFMDLLADDKSIVRTVFGMILSLLAVSLLAG